MVTSAKKTRPTRVILPRPQTVVEVNLSAIQSNAQAARKLLSSKTHMMAVVKANAYGHGLLRVAEALSTPRLTDSFGVASLEEGIALRNFGITLPILVLGPTRPEDAPLVSRYNLAQTVYTKPLAEALARAGRRAKEPVRVHLKADTGMGRYGLWHEQAVSFAKWIRKQRGVLMEGFFTHLSSTESDRSFTVRQLQIFQGLVAELERNGIHVPLKHVANSMGLLSYPEAHWDMVRPGLMLYGVCPKPGWKPPVSLKPALRWKSHVAFIKPTPSGRTISYGKTHTTSRATRIATVPVGYANGYPRSLSNQAEVLIRGKRMPVVGRITMDHLMVDARSYRGVRAGDAVTLLGKDRGVTISADELAVKAKTISYEILCGISPSISRRYPKPRNSRAR